MMMRRGVSRRAGSTGDLATGGVLAAQDKLVIEAGRIITQAGPDIENGVIVIENGRITAIGAADEVDKPWDAPVHGGPDLTDPVLVTPDVKKAIADLIPLAPE